MQQTESNELTAATWEHVRPLLDSALCNLAEHDRVPILLRYFEGQPYGEVAGKLGISENSARMRADRALEKLRQALLQQGITSTAVALGAVLSTQAVAAAPVGLASTLATTALAQSAVTGSGFGIVAKLSQLASFNKAPSGYAAVATLGAAGVV